jgi:MOSC domain-containing protein YiiM
VIEKLSDGSIIRRSGIMGIVLAGGAVRAGDAIRVEAPVGVERRLEPV